MSSLEFKQQKRAVALPQAPPRKRKRALPAVAAGLGAEPHLNGGVTVKKLLAIFICLLLFLPGCFALPVEETRLPPPVFSAPEPVQWLTVPARQMDVVWPVSMTAAYTSARQASAFFSEAGIEVEYIFVTAGDEVYEGQILASLYMPEEVRLLEEAIRRQERLAMEITHAEERHRHSLRRAELTGIPFDDSSYIQQRGRLREQMDFLQAEVTHLSELESARYVFAPKAGTVLQALAFREGLLSTFTAVAVITDTPDTVFVLSHMHAGGIMPGDVFEMALMQGGQTYEVIAEVIDPDTLDYDPWEALVPQVFLVVADPPTALEPGTLGRITYTFVASDVIAVPTRNIRHLDDRNFVFVLENGVRRVRYIEIGLQAVDYTEVISGLEAGELIII